MAGVEAADGAVVGAPLSTTESDEEAQAEESTEEREPLRFGATSTVSQFQTSGCLLIPRVRADELEPERSLRLLNLDTSWLHPPEPESELEVQKQKQPNNGKPKPMPELDAWRTDDTKLHQKLLQLEEEIEQKHLEWKQVAGLCVPVEQLQQTNGDQVRANQIQVEIQDRLQQIAALRRERAEFRRQVAETWRVENTAAFQAALAQRVNAWKYVVHDANRKHKDAAIRVAEQVRKELDIALRPWSVREAAEQRLGLHSGESTSDDIRAAFEAGVQPDAHGAVSGVLNLRGKVNGAKAASLLGTILNQLSVPLLRAYTNLDLSFCELSAPAFHEITEGMWRAFGGIGSSAPGGRLRILDLHGAKWCPPEDEGNGKTGLLSTLTLASNHEKVCADCCAALAQVLPDSLTELSFVSGLASASLAFPSLA